jgi:hypothetical protein
MLMTLSVIPPARKIAPITMNAVTHRRAPAVSRSSQVAGWKTGRPEPPA